MLGYGDAQTAGVKRDGRSIGEHDHDATGGDRDRGETGAAA